MDELKTGVFEGRAAYEEALRSALLAACAQESRAIHGISGSFVDWPLSDRTVLEALTAWVRRGRMLQLMGRDFEDLRQRHPRFVQWRTTFDHCFEAREYEAQGGDSRSPLAALFVTGGARAVSVRLFDEEHWRGTVSVEARDSVLLQEWFDVLAQRASPSFPASTLGL
ncbi:MAG: hypothetical protein JO006_08270 [Paucibacter sp.]|nr:hypothetical protein [Roseateles sp.]